MRELVLTFVLVGSLALAACNTVSGAGRDLQSASNTVENEMN